MVLRNDVLCGSSPLNGSYAGPQTLQQLLHASRAEYALLQLHAQQMHCSF